MLQSKGRLHTLLLLSTTAWQKLLPWAFSYDMDTVSFGEPMSQNQQILVQAKANRCAGLREKHW